MPVNTFNGVSCFGASVKMTPMPIDAALQINEYIGVNGQESLALGLRGMITEVRGILTGATLSDLSIAQVIMFSFNDGLPRDFYDSMSRGWTNVIMRGLRPVAGFKPAGARGYFWHYQVQMYHLTNT